MTDAEPSLPDLLLLDGELVPPAEATVSVLDRGLLYGESLFETLKVVDGAPCLWREHLDRLVACCRELDIPLDPGGLGSGVRRLLRARPVHLGALRIQVTGGVQPGGGRGMTASAEGRAPRVIATVQPVSPVPEATYWDGVDVVTAADLARPLPWLKSGSYLASVAGKRRAEAAGAFECLFVAGEPPSLLEGSFSNVLLWDGARLTAPPAGVALRGVTLRAVLAAAEELGRDTSEGPILLETARRASLLLTGSLLGVCACRSLDGVRLRPATDLAGELRQTLERQEAASRESWRTEARADMEGTESGA